MKHKWLSVISLFIILFISSSSFAQSSDEFSNIKVEELTDDQIRRFIQEVNRLRLTDEDTDKFALDHGMSPVEIVKLKHRVEAYRKSQATQNYTTTQNQRQVIASASDTMIVRERQAVSDFNLPFQELIPNNFAYGVFQNPRVTFEPNLRLATPKNYVLAADDEILIDVYGYSEASYRLKVSPEGLIKIPIAGAINVNGLTIEQAKRLIIQKLSSSIYTNIKNGKTNVEVSLGNIRSIKVNIIGEAVNPGTYTLPSLATAFNALYLCGGPNRNGSYRNIQVIRNNTVVATIDVYDYLVNGSRKQDIRLMDQDAIKINVYKTRIELKGEVKKPGIFDVKEGEKLNDLIQYAGGFTDQAYTAKIQVYRNTSVDRMVTTISADELPMAVPQKGDSYVIGRILNRFKNRISIKGAVFRPGEYELRPNMTLSKLIEEADGIREDAFTTRGTIQRLKTDLSPELIPFNLEKIQSGEQTDIVLKKEDQITVYSKFDLKEGYFVSIDGEVANPGAVVFQEGITVKDMILLSGGLKEAASLKRIEVSRRIKDADPNATNAITATIFQVDVNAQLIDSSGIDSFRLAPFDEVSVRTAPGYFEQKNAVVAGEVIYSGKYTLQTKIDRISDLIKRAGGLTPEAYIKGAVLIRSKNVTKFEIDNTEQGLNNLLKQNYNAGTTSAILQRQLESIAFKKSERVGIDLEKILSSPHSEYDLLLNDGDTLIIPKQLQTVRVNGEVLYPTLVRYSASSTFKDYINGAGGFSDRSARKRSYVVYANGSVKGTNSFLLFRSYPKIKPGAEIFVPIKREKERLRTIEMVSIGTALVTMLAILSQVIK